jgi:hypothetical protein
VPGRAEHRAGRLQDPAAGGGSLIGEPGSMESRHTRLTWRRTTSRRRHRIRPTAPDRPLVRLLSGLRESRERLLEVASRVDGRMVARVTIRHFQLGELDFYQWLALEAAHESKHLAQICRIKSHPEFPRADSARRLSCRRVEQWRRASDSGDYGFGDDGYPFPQLPAHSLRAWGQHGLRTAHLMTSGILLGGHVFDVSAHRLIWLLYLPSPAASAWCSSSVFLVPMGLPARVSWSA